LHSYNYAPLPIEYLPQSDEQEALHQVKETFTKAVVKRLMSDRPVCALLSGGLDSSLVASIVARHIAPQKLNTFCIGIEGSTDLHFAKLVAKHINSNHHIVELKEEDFLSAIDETIRIIESYDITSVRASVGNLLVSKYIANNTDCKVVYNGDYSDEVCGGYMYLKKAPSDEEFHNECSRLVKEITYFDSLRSDRTISSQGLEARVPFSDTEFVNTYMSINPSLRVSHSRIEKYLLRKAFSEDNLLPNEVLWRYKEAFSDGVSKPERSWHNVIKEYIDKVITDEEFQQESGKFSINTPPSKEAYYYRKVFESFYPNMGHVIPQFWLPRWSDNIQDPSARELEVYTC
jgi:asparagine synthase (glutamine-hydrolysing)